MKYWFFAFLAIASSAFAIPYNKVQIVDPTGSNIGYDKVVIVKESGSGVQVMDQSALTASGTFTIQTGTNTSTISATDTGLNLNGTPLFTGTGAVVGSGSGNAVGAVSGTATNLTIGGVTVNTGTAQGGTFNPDTLKISSTNAFSLFITPAQLASGTAGSVTAAGVIPGVTGTGVQVQSGTNLTITGTGGNVYTKTQVDAAIPTINPNNGSSRLGFVANGKHIPSTQSWPQCMARSVHRATDNITSVELAFPNFKGAEVSTSGTLYVEASVEYPANTFTRVTFSGSNSYIIPAGTLAFSDLITLSTPIPVGATFWVRTYCTHASGVPVTTVGYGASGYDYSQLANSVTNVVMTSGTGAMSPSNVTYGPCAVIGLTAKPSVMIIGDSIAAGSSDTADSTGDVGMSRLVGGLYGYVNLGVGGDSASAFFTTHTQRMRLSQYATHVLGEYGINDFGTAVAVAGAVSSVASLFSIQPVYWTTLTPYTTSTDNWSTIAGQTFASSDSARITFNQMLRSKSISGISAYVEIADSIESARDSGYWNVNGSSNWMTSDGLHPNALGYSTMRDGLGNPFLAPRQFVTPQKLATFTSDYAWFNTPRIISFNSNDFSSTTLTSSGQIGKQGPLIAMYHNGTGSAVRALLPDDPSSNNKTLLCMSGSSAGVDFTKTICLSFWVNFISDTDARLRVNFGRAGTTTNSGVLGALRGSGFQVVFERTASNTFSARICLKQESSDFGISGATNASPIVITDNNHSMATGDLVEITGANGNTAANGIWTVTKTDANNYSLNGSTGNGTWTSGGCSQRTTASSSTGLSVGKAYHCFLIKSGTAQTLCYGSPNADPDLTLLRPDNTTTSAVGLTVGVGWESVTASSGGHIGVSDIQIGVK